ncbi:MAG: RNA-binding protein [Acidobacteria bacterium]|nr:RNA-binding protein [Acidobacteriota bacterium]MBU4255595.1 RNA-binding protein [Acidobacteriota bacterium]MBU4330027.1 RNA-binding protein [Acidobacteriota bacterium]
MSMNIYVGNLSFNVKDSDLKEAFEAFGTVESAKVIEDRDTGRSRGFGFVEMPNKSEGESAIAGMNGKNLMDRDLKVNEAKPKTEGGRGGGGFGGGGGGRRY